MKLHLGLALRIRKKINNRRCCYLFELLQNSEISPTVLTTVSFAAFSVVNFRTRTSCPEIPWFNPVSQCLLSFFHLFTSLGKQIQFVIWLWGSKFWSIPWRLWSLKTVCHKVCHKIFASCQPAETSGIGVQDDLGGTEAQQWEKWKRGTTYQWPPAPSYELLETRRLLKKHLKLFVPTEPHCSWRRTSTTTMEDGNSDWRNAVHVDKLRPWAKGTNTVQMFFDHLRTSCENTSPWWHLWFFLKERRS